jgi:tetratricopeptide (TPR) repeat protein
MESVSELLANMQAKFGARDFPEVHRICDEILRQEPDNTLALNALGAALVSTDQAAEGAKVLERALAIDPKSSLTLRNLAEAYRITGNATASIACLEPALERTPDAPELWRSLVRAYLRNRQYDHAKRTLERTIAKGVRTAETCGDYSLLLYSMGRYQECDFFARQMAEENCSDCFDAAIEAANLSRTLLLIGWKSRKVAKKDTGDGAVFVFGVTGRCGTTLIQRLLNSSSRILVFGEDRHLGLHSPLDIKALAGTKVQLSDSVDEDRRRVLRGEDFWSPRVYPDLDQYLDIALAGYFSSVRFVAKSAKSLKNSSRWGVKIPDPDAMRTVMSLLPEARYIFIYRNIFDTARSYKSRGWLHDIEDCRKLGREWQQRLGITLPMQAENLLQIKYETLVTSPNSEIERIRSFTGIADIQDAVILRKLNNFGEAEQSYVPPADLTVEELAALSETAGVMAAELGYAS